MSTDPKVLMVDDDPDVRHSVARGLRMSGFAVTTAVDGSDALRKISTDAPDALVLDIQMPGLDGVAVVTALRAMGNEVPICVLSALDTVNDRVAGLEAGADDYLIKPFDITELVARLRALLRRTASSEPTGGGARVVGPLQIDLARRLVFMDGKRVDLTKREFELLATLSADAGVVFSRERLMELVWGYDFAADTNVVDVFISYLRRKLEAGGADRLVQTVRGVGFVLREQSPR
ncbi:response regulator transcription factor [Rhodococcus sp. NPDC049939]|uniref:response regulator transcription factor n=1 Tax=Rhodococcus sp. NPDC049939 TaxID=3155511 RepID=UPI0033CEE0EE